MAASVDANTAAMKGRAEKWPGRPIVSRHDAGAKHGLVVLLTRGRSTLDGVILEPHLGAEASSSSRRYVGQQ